MKDRIMVRRGLGKSVKVASELVRKIYLVRSRIRDLANEEIALRKQLMATIEGSVNSSLGIPAKKAARKPLVWLDKKKAKVKGKAHGPKRWSRAHRAKFMKTMRLKRIANGVHNAVHEPAPKKK